MVLNASVSGFIAKVINYKLDVDISGVEQVQLSWSLALEKFTIKMSIQILKMDEIFEKCWHFIGEILVYYGKNM